jgi:hypothetical protein
VQTCPGFSLVHITLPAIPPGVSLQDTQTVLPPFSCFISLFVNFFINKKLFLLCGGRNRTLYVFHLKATNPAVRDSLNYLSYSYFFHTPCPLGASFLATKQWMETNAGSRLNGVPHGTGGVRLSVCSCYCSVM